MVDMKLNKCDNSNYTIEKLWQLYAFAAHRSRWPSRWSTFLRPVLLWCRKYEVFSWLQLFIVASSNAESSPVEGHLWKCLTHSLHCGGLLAVKSKWRCALLWYSCKRQPCVPRTSCHYTMTKLNVIL